MVVPTDFSGRVWYLLNEVSCTSFASEAQNTLSLATVTFWCSKRSDTTNKITPLPVRD
jgi:hypothetical protein